MENYLLGCDWGTSSFRLGLYSVTEGGLVDEIQSNDGISGMHSDWQQRQHEKNGGDKDRFFRDRLLAQIQVLEGRMATSLKDTPLLISGMASSSIGLEDIPYAAIPFRLDGSQVKTRRFAAQHYFPHEIMLISGVKSEHDVMRGEETQLIGIWSLLTDRNKRPSEAIVIFPGTHSKHVYVKDEVVTGFRTFMTGEMYQVTGNHSILKDSVTTSGEEYAPGAAELQAFAQGIKKSAESGILNSLFTVRTNQLFNRLDKKQNAFYLSGLLIGSELQELQKSKDSPVLLCSGKKLSGLYKLALEEMGMAERTTFIPAELVEQAAMTGQKIIYDQYVNNKLLNE